MDGADELQSIFMKFTLATSIRLLFYALIAGFVVFYFRNDLIAYPLLNLSLKTPSPEVIQVFCDEGNGFNEALSSSLITTSIQQKGEPFDLPLPGDCKRLRLDLGGKGSTVKVISARLISGKGDSRDIYENIISPAYLNEVSLSKKQIGEFFATDNDPYVVLRGEYSNATALVFPLWSLLKMMILFASSFIIIVFIDYWLNKTD